MRTSAAVVAMVAALSWSAAPADASWSSGGSGLATAKASSLAAPTGLVATCNGLLSTAIDLNWTATTTPWADGYEVRRGTSSGNYTTSTLVTGTSYTTPSLSAGTYYFVVRATKGAWRSPNSNQVQKRITSLLFIGLSCE